MKFLCFALLKTTGVACIVSDLDSHEPLQHDALIPLGNRFSELRRPSKCWCISSHDI